MRSARQPRTTDTPTSARHGSEACRTGSRFCSTTDALHLRARGRNDTGISSRLEEELLRLFAACGFAPDSACAKPQAAERGGYLRSHPLQLTVTTPIPTQISSTPTQAIAGNRSFRKIQAPSTSSAGFNPSNGKIRLSADCCINPTHRKNHKVSAPTPAAKFQMTLRHGRGLRSTPFIACFKNNCPITSRN